jgi:hypothetical protein
LGGTPLASNPGNWSGGIPPANADSVLFDGSAVSNNCTWDLNIAIQDWMQTAAYTGTVTILTRYPGHGLFTNLSILGNAYLSNGTWTHPANSGGSGAVDCLRVTIGGDWVVESNAQINVDGKGYAAGRGPGAGQTSTQRGAVPATAVLGARG